MQLRLYKFNKKHTRKDGTVTIGPNRQWKWVKGETKQRKYRRRGQGMDLWSKRFGYLDSYTSKERKLLVCPSGYTFGQGMHALNRLWFAYKISKSEANIDQMEHYARAIQEVQEDIGLKTTSFPHLGIYGDKLILYEHNSNSRKIAVEVDHSHLKEKTRLEEEKKRLEEIISTLPIPLEPDEENGEKVITIADEIPFHLKEKTRLEEEKKKLEEIISTLPIPLEPDEENGEKVITIADDIPRPPPIPLEPDEENGEKVITIADDIPRPLEYSKSHSNRIHYEKVREEDWYCENCEEIVPPGRNHICESRTLTLSDEIPFEYQEN